MSRKPEKKAKHSGVDLAEFGWVPDMPREELCKLLSDQASATRRYAFLLRQSEAERCDLQRTASVYEEELQDGALMRDELLRHLQALCDSCAAYLECSDKPNQHSLTCEMDNARFQIRKAIHERFRVDLSAGCYGDGRPAPPGPVKPCERLDPRSGLTDLIGAPWVIPGLYGRRASVGQCGFCGAGNCDGHGAIFLTANGSRCEWCLRREVAAGALAQRKGADD